MDSRDLQGLMEAYTKICAPVDEAVYGGEPKKPEDTRMVVTAADKRGNTKAYQNYKAGHKGYKAADHLGEESVDEAVKGASPHTMEMRKGDAADRRKGIKPKSAKEGERYASYKMAQMAHSKRERMGEEVEQIDEISANLALTASQKADEMRRRAAVAGDKETASKKAAQASRLYAGVGPRRAKERQRVDEATAMAKRGYDEAPIRQKIAKSTGGGEAADRATKLAGQQTYGQRGVDPKARQNLARAQRGDFRQTTSSSPGLHGYGYKSDDPAVKAKQAARGAQRGALTPAEKKQLNREEFDLFDAVLEYLVAEGYAATNKEALVIMANMSEEWKQDIVEGMTMKDFKQQRSRQKQKEKRAADKIAPTRRAGIHTPAHAPERAARHRANVDPDFEGNDERNYPGGKLNPKKVRKAKAMGELGEGVDLFD